MGELVLDPKDSGTQPQRNCVQCGSNLGEKDFACPNCGDNQQAVGQPHARKVQDRGKQFNPHSNDPHSNPLQVQRGVPIPKLFDSSLDIKEATIKDTKEKDTVDPNVVPFKSDEILQCVDPSELPRRKKRRKVDDKIEEVSKSCLDLAIDG